MGLRMFCAGFKPNMSIKEQTDKRIEAIRALRLWMQEQIKIETSGSLSALNNGFYFVLLRRKLNVDSAKMAKL